MTQIWDVFGDRPDDVFSMALRFKVETSSGASEVWDMVSNHIFLYTLLHEVDLLCKALNDLSVALIDDQGRYLWLLGCTLMRDQ